MSKTIEKKIKHGSKKHYKWKASFKEWREKHRKGLLIAYYSSAAILIVICVGIILNNLVTRTETVEEEDTIYYWTKYEDDDSLELGTEKTTQEGENGIRKTTYEKKRRLITGEIVSSEIINTENLKDPTDKIIRQGTRKWQYMICSDGSYRYYTDEQFKNKNTGFTHSSEDYCATNNQGTMIALADDPPSANSYSNNGMFSDSYIRALNLIAERERELRNNSSNSATYDEANSTYQSTLNNEAAEKEANEMARQKAWRLAENRCRSEESKAYQSLMNQLGAMGAGGGSEARYEIPRMANEVYRNCMNQYGY